MAQENVERLRAVYAAFNAGEGIDLELLTPDVEFVQPEVGESAYFGREGVERGIRSYRRAGRTPRPATGSRSDPCRCSGCRVVV